MSLTGAIVTYAVSFFICLLLILPRGVPTQQEAGEIEPGTPAGAPADISIGRKFLWAGLAALVPTLGLAGIMEWDVLTLDDFEFLYPASFQTSPAGAPD